MTRMLMKIVVAGLCFTASFADCLQSVRAASPFSNLFVKVDADPNADYKITEKNGPWMINAYVFSGDNAEKQAQELVCELRREHKLLAFTHKHEIDHSKKWNGPHIDRWGKQEVLRNEHNEKLKQVAVLVGNYAGVEDNEAANTLKMIKKLEPACLMKGNTSKDPLASGIENFRKTVDQQKNVDRWRWHFSRPILCCRKNFSNRRVWINS